MIRIGTSGYSYDDWVGPFYPADLPKSDWLSFYAREFDTAEINFSYYRQPTAWTLERMAAKVPDSFSFTIKAFQGLTHERAEGNDDQFRTFLVALKPWIEQKKLGAILAQFPWSFRATAENADYLKRFRWHFENLPVVIEFRNRDWLSNETFDLLREHQLGFCAVDEPRFKSLMPPIAAVTAPVAYVRFHGRNAQKWWKHDKPEERYDYTYQDEELAEWVPKIRQMEEQSRTTYVFMNNHRNGQAIGSARQMSMILSRAGTNSTENS